MVTAQVVDYCGEDKYSIKACRLQSVKSASFLCRLITNMLPSHDSLLKSFQKRGPNGMFSLYSQMLGMEIVSKSVQKIDFLINCIYDIYFDSFIK